VQEAHPHQLQAIGEEYPAHRHALSTLSIVVLLTQAMLSDLMDRNKLLVHPGREDSLVDDASSSVGSVSEQGDDQPFPSCNDAGMEELYEMLDNIQDAVTFTPDRQLSRSRELQLERLKDEVGQFEERIAEMQRDFRTINTRARQLQSEVTPSNGQSLWEERFLLSVSGEDADPHSLSNMIGFALRRFQDTGRSLGWIPVEETGGRDSVNSIYLNHNGWTSVDRERWLTNNYLRVGLPTNVKGTILKSQLNSRSPPPTTSTSPVSTAISATCTSLPTWWTMSVT